MAGRERLAWTDEGGLLQRFFEKALANDAAHALGCAGADLRDADRHLPGGCEAIAASLAGALRIRVRPQRRQAGDTQDRRSLARLPAFRSGVTFDRLHRVVEETGDPLRSHGDGDARQARRRPPCPKPVSAKGPSQPR